MNSDINFELYKMFYIVAKSKSFSRAAEIMFISQSAVTQTIKKLEEQLNAILFVRSKRGVELTNEGKIIFDYISSSIETIDNVENLFSRYQKLEKGNIKIAAGTTLTKNFMFKSLMAFIKDYPNINISIENIITSDAIKKLETGYVDIVLLNLTSKINYDNIKIIKIKDTEDIFFTNKKYYEKIKNDKITLSNLYKYNLVFPNSGTNSRIFLEDCLKKKNIEIQPSYEIASSTLLIDFVENTESIGIISKCLIEEEIKKGNFYEIHTGINFEKKRYRIGYTR